MMSSGSFFPNRDFNRGNVNKDSPLITRNFFKAKKRNSTSGCFNISQFYLDPKKKLSDIAVIDEEKMEKNGKYTLNHGLDSDREQVEVATKIPTINCDYELSEYSIGAERSSSNTLSRSSGSMAASESCFPKRTKTTMGEKTKFIFSSKTKYDQQSGFEGIKKSEYLHKKYEVNTIMQCIISIASVFSVFIEHEVAHMNRVNYTEWRNRSHNLIMWISFISSVILWVTIIFEYYINAQLLSHAKKIAESSWLRDRSRVVRLIIKLVIYLPHPNPVFKDVQVSLFNQKYEITMLISFNSFLGILCLIRLWFVVKFLLILSKFYSSRFQRVCDMNSFDITIPFIIKTNMRKHPYLTYLCSFTVFLVFATFGLHAFERELDDKKSNTQVFASYWNSLWCLIMTMTTVGIGDFYPSSLAGRVIGILSSLYGVLLVSMLIVTICNVLTFRGNEQMAFGMLERISLSEERDTIAIQLIAKYAQLIKLLKRKQGTANDKKIHKLREDLLVTMLRFKEKSQDIKATFPPHTHIDTINVELDEMLCSLSQLERRFGKLIKELSFV